MGDLGYRRLVAEATVSPVGGLRGLKGARVSRYVGDYAAAVASVSMNRPGSDVGTHAIPGRPNVRLHARRSRPSPVAVLPTQLAQTSSHGSLYHLAEIELWVEGGKHLGLESIEAVSVGNRDDV